jgi:terminase large subunit-like protein
VPDVGLLRSSLAAFADAIGCGLTRWQAAALELEARVTVVVAPRQSGKSRSLSVLALHRAFRQPGYRVLIVSAGEEASRRLLAEVRRLATSSPLLSGSVVDEAASLVRLSNGSEIRSVPASERQVRGWSVDLLLADEAALIPDDLLLGGAFPTIAARPDGRIVLASSPLTASGSFYDHCVRGEQGSEHVRTFRWRLTDAEWISPSVVASARESMSEARFRCEYEGEFASGQDALFSRSLLDAVTVDIHHYGLDELPVPARYAVGVDWGLVNDRTVATAIGRLAIPGPPIFAVACCRRWPAGFPNLRAIAEIRASPAAFAWVCSETNGLGAPLTDSLFAALRARALGVGGGRPRPSVVVLEEGEFDPLRPAPPAFVRPRSMPPTAKVAVTMTGPRKAALFGALRLLIERRQLLIPVAADDLIRELLTLRVDFSASGHERIEARSGHDDTAVSLALALRPMRDGRIRLAELARAGGAPEELPTLPHRPGRRSVEGRDPVSPEPDVPHKPPPDPRRVKLANELRAALELQARNTTEGVPHGA